jgi:hypothetical protein
VSEISFVWRTSGRERTISRMNSNEHPIADPGRRRDLLCAHCHRPLLVESFHPRWRGYCLHCVEMLTRLHVESA